MPGPGAELARLPQAQPQSQRHRHLERLDGKRDVERHAQRHAGDRRQRREPALDMVVDLIFRKGQLRSDPICSEALVLTSSSNADNSPSPSVLQGFGAR